MSVYTLHKLPKEGFIITSDEDILVHQDQIDFSALSEKEKKDIGWFDIENLARMHENIINHSKNSYIPGFKDGFQKAIELLSDERFTSEDIKESIRYGFDVGFCSNSSNKVKNNLMSEDSFIKSLSNPKSWQVELEIGVECQGKTGEPCLCLEKFGYLKNECKKHKFTNGKVKVTNIIL
jgi:hypothetical protein